MWRISNWSTVELISCLQCIPVKKINSTYMYHFFFLGNSHLVYAIIRKRNIFHQVCFYDNFLSSLCVLKLRLIPLYILYLKDLNTKVFIHEYPFTNNSYNVFYPTVQQNHIMSAQKTSNSFFSQCLLDFFSIFNTKMENSRLPK